jgi:hypothetical protein
MPPLLSKIQQHVVEALLRGGEWSHADIVKETRVSLGQIRKMSANLRGFDTAVTPKVRTRGRLPALSVEIMEVLVFVHAQS